MNGGAVARGLKAVALLVGALAIVALAIRFWPAADPVPEAAAKPVWGPSDYRAALAALDHDIAREKARVAADPASWMRQEALAMALHARGQLAGSHADLAAAVSAADAARAAAPDGSGPVLARAIVNLSMHRNALAAGEVRRMAGFAIPAEPADRAEAEAILGDVALYSGHYAAALQRYRAADDLTRSAGTLVRLADWHRHRGDFATARGLLEEGLAAGAPPWMEATYLLQIGAIDLQAGDWSSAERRFAQADAAFPGWWLARAHRAQMAAVRGDFASAEALYRQALEGAERPSVMEALAAVLRERERAEEAETLELRAGSLWARYAAAFPEAYADHAFEAALREEDSLEAWRHAALNYRARPYGDGRIGLARAAAARGRDASARAILEELDRTGWRSTEQYRVLAEVCGRLGDRGCVEEAREKALAISPLAFDPRADLLFFGNH